MNAFKKYFAACVLVLLTGASSHLAFAGEDQTGMAQPINATVGHLESALTAINGKDLQTAQDEISAAKQSSKDIFGGSLESKKQRGSKAISNARHLAKEGDLAGAADALKQAIEVFKSLLQPVNKGSQGEL